MQGQFLSSHSLAIHRRAFTDLNTQKSGEAVILHVGWAVPTTTTCDLVGTAQFEQVDRRDTQEFGRAGGRATAEPGLTQVSLPRAVRGRQGSP